MQQVFIGSFAVLLLSYFLILTLLSFFSYVHFVISSQITYSVVVLSSKITYSVILSSYAYFVLSSFCARFIILFFYAGFVISSCTRFVISSYTHFVILFYARFIVSFYTQSSSNLSYIFNSQNIQTSLIKSVFGTLINQAQPYQVFLSVFDTQPLVKEKQL